MSCGDSNPKEIRLIKSAKSFADIFEPAGSVMLKPKDFDTPVSFSITNNKEFILCDYNKKKVQLLDSAGNFKKDILRDTIDGKVLGSPLCVAINNDNGNIFIADNSNRRIYVLDSNYTYKSSFLVSGSHMTPVYMQSYGDFLYMSGHNVNTDYFIHVYSTEGVYQKSFYKSKSANKKNTYVNGAGNYIRFDKMNEEIYAVEMMNFGVSKTDSSLKENTFLNFASEYFTPLTKESLKSISENFEEVKSTFAKPSFIKCANNNVFVFSELPAKNNFDDFFNTRHYIVDIFKNDLSPEINGVDIGSMIPIGYHTTSGAFAFIGQHNKTDNSYTINFFKFKK